MARHGERGWALCGLCIALLASEASAAAPPAPPDMRQVQIDLVVARAPRGEFPFASLDEEGLRDYRRRLEKGVREGRVKIDAEPRLVTRSGDPASYFAGSEHPVEYRDAAGRPEVRCEKVGTCVSALLTVGREGQVSLDLEVESSHFCEKAGYPAVNRIFMTAEVKPGGSLVVVVKQACGDPGEERDLVVLCTPTVLRAPQVGE